MRPHWLVTALLVIATALAGSDGLRPGEAPAAGLLPPAVLGWSPGVSRAVPLDGPITVSFNRDMDRASVEAAWSLTPRAAGSFSWSGSSVTFQPSRGLRPWTAYHVSVGRGARDVFGLALARPFVAAFVTGDPLSVRSFTPQAGTTGVPANALIAVSFNHPMVTLAGLSAAPQRPSGWSLSIRPSVAGQGSWLGTSTWVFRPETGLAPSTRYTVWLGGGVRDATGQPLGRTLRWSFQTVTPEVIGERPGNNTGYDDPSTAVTVTFNQPMDRSATERAFNVRSGGAPVPGSLRWRGNTLVFRPAAPFPAASSVTASVAPFARSANGRGTVGKSVVWRFQVAPLPRLVSTTPEQGGVMYGQQVQLTFSAPMDKASLDRHLVVRPKLGFMQTSLSGVDYGPNSANYSLYGSFRPSTPYTLTVRAGVRDRFGRGLPRSYTLHFTTNMLTPTVALYGAPGPGDGIAFTAGQKMDAPVQVVNVPKVHYTLIRTTFGAVTNLQGGAPPDGTTVRSWSEQLLHPLNGVENLGVPLANKDGSPLTPGLYWLGATAPESTSGLPPDSGPPESSELVLVENVSVTVKTGGNGTLVWVTSADTGKPLAGVTVHLLSYRDSPLATGATDARGMHFFPPIPNDGVEYAAVFDSTHFGAAKTYWGPQVTFPREGLTYQYGPTPGGSYLYTDRPLYRPGQTVHFRAVIWRANDGVFSRFGPQAASIWVNDPWGHALYHGKLPLDRFGSVHGSVRLPASVPTGDGQIGVSLNRFPTQGAYGTFSIAAYRKPEFLTAVRADRTDYVQGQRLTARVGVRYVFGAPVARQPVVWTAYFQPSSNQPPGWDQYSFFDWETYWQQVFNPNQPQSQFGNVTLRGRGRTDARGQLAVQIPVDLRRSPIDGTITLEATTTDVNHQSVSGRAQVAAHKSAFALGLQAAQQAVLQGQSVSIDAVAVRPDGSALSGQKLTVSIYRRTYSSRLTQQNGSSYWQSIPHDTLYSRRALTTGPHGHAAISFTPPQGGEYYVAVQSKDALGNLVKNSLSIYVGAGNFSDWGTSSSTAVRLKPDRSTYQVGDLAHVLVAAPFDHGVVLVTVERGNIRMRRVQTFTTNSPRLDIPVRLDYLPNVYVTVTLYRDWQNGSPPDWRYGLTELHVRVDPRHLIVHLAQNRARYHPRDVVTYTVTTTDARGRPVSAQLSLALVDTAVLALKNEQNPDILQAFYAEQPLRVSTASDGVLSIDHLTQKPTFRVPPNNVGGLPVLNGAPLPVPAAVPPKTGGGGGPPPGLTVRSRFRDTAYWAGTVGTGPSGRATLRIRLPDNATTWRLDARGTTSGMEVGQARLRTLVTQDIVARPLLPRFFLEGDTLQVGAAVNNNLSWPVPMRVFLSASGLSIRNTAPQTVTVPAHGERLALWPVSVPPGRAARVEVRAVPLSRKVQGDAVLLRLPVHPPLTDETVATAGQVFGSVTQYVLVPRNAVPSPGALTVRVSASLTGGTGAVLPSFKPQQYESNEDVAERVLVAASLRSIPTSLSGLSRSQYAHLWPTVQAGVQKLIANQYPDGGWPWFNGPFEYSDPQISATAVQALSAARPLGPAGSSALQRGREYLDGALDGVLDAERAHLLAVLAQSGPPDRSGAERLYNNAVRRHHLEVAPLAELGGALALAGDRAKGQTTVSAVDSQAKVSATGAHWEGAGWEDFGQPAVSTTVQVLQTLLTLDPRDPFVPAGIRWLTLARQGDLWDCSYDTAEAVALLARYARMAHEGLAAYQYQVLVNGRLTLVGRYGAGNQRQTAVARVPVGRLSPARAGSLVLARGVENGTFGPGPFYYVARLHYYLQANSIAPRNEGLAVQRRYLDLAGHQIWTARAGSPVRVQLTVHTDQTLLYLHLRDPVPSGLEPVDETLQTSQQGLAKPQWWWNGNTPDLSWFITHTDLRDDQVDLYAEYLPPGTYHYTYLAQATVSGRYAVAPTRGWETFFPEVFGRSAGQTFTVT